ncbi:MAG TPA: hypothetical protein VGN51_03040 [Acidimicrobiia bacterium]|jgi:hypothetical protein
MAIDLQAPRRRRSGSTARWCAVLVFGFVVGAALVLLTDSDPNESSVSATPTAANAATPTAGSSAASSNAGVTDVNGAHVHGVKAQDIAAETQPDVPLDAPTRELVAQQLTTARSHAMQYPTVADATAAGYHLAGGFAPGSGAHYVGGPITGGGTFDPNAVQSLIYDGTNSTSKIVGLMYYAMGDAPEGFAGPNDHWHRHSHVCIKPTATGIDVPFPADAEVSQAQCSEVGGLFMSITGYMVHAWVVPGWESPQGVFSHENVNVRCADGTYNTTANGMCQGT